MVDLLTLTTNQIQLGIGILFSSLPPLKVNEKLSPNKAGNYFHIRINFFFGEGDLALAVILGQLESVKHTLKLLCDQTEISKKNFINSSTQNSVCKLLFYKYNKKTTNSTHINLNY